MKNYFSSLNIENNEKCKGLSFIYLIHHRKKHLLKIPKSLLLSGSTSHALYVRCKASVTKSLDCHRVFLSRLYSIQPSINDRICVAGSKAMAAATEYATAPNDVSIPQASTASSALGKHRRTNVGSLLRAN